MPRFPLVSLAAITAVSALRVQQPELIGAIHAFRAEMCAHQEKDADTYADCHKFMTEQCNPGPDGKIDGSPGERTTGAGHCKAFFNRGEAPAGATPAAEAAEGAEKPVDESVVAFTITEAGDATVKGKYVVDGTSGAFTRYRQHGGKHTVIHVNDYWLVHRGTDVCYAVKSDKRTPPSVGWVQAPNSPCSAHPMPRFRYGKAAGRPTVGDIVTIVRADIPEHRQYLRKSGVITQDLRDEQPFQIASLGGEWFYDEEVVMGHEFPCQTFDGHWLNDMDGWEKEEIIADGTIDDWDFRVSDDCHTCYMSHHGYKLTGQMSAGGLYIHWNNGHNWTKFVAGEAIHRVVNMTKGDLKLQGPLPFGFGDILAKAISAATTGVRPMDVKTDEIRRLDDGMVIVQFRAPYDAVVSVQKQAADMHSKLANGVLRKFLMVRSSYHHNNEWNAEFSAH